MDGSDGRQETSLFRPEAVSEARNRLGSPVKPTALSSWLLTGFLTALLVVALIFLFTARYARKETVSGILQPMAGANRVIALRAGVIAEVHVREGQIVERGQPIVTLSLDPIVIDGRRLGDILSNASADQTLALDRQIVARRDSIARQREELAAKRAALLEQARRLRTDAVLQRERLLLTQQTAEASRILWEKQLMSAVQYRQREEAYVIARQGLAAIERDQAAVPTSLAQLSAQDRRLLAEAEDSAATLALSAAQLAERRASAQAESQIVLTAQKGGEIAALQAKSGSSVVAGTPLAIVLPTGVKLQAELWVPSRAIGFVRAGDTVRLMFDAFPYQRFGVGHGRIAEVARAPVAPADLPLPLKTEEAMYRIVVDLDDQAIGAYGRRWALAPGMRLSADIILEQDTLMAWLFDKVRAARVRATPL